MRSANVRLALLIIASIMTVVFLSGVVAAIVTDKSPYEWFKKDDVIIDEPVVEEVLPLVASNEEEMNSLLVEENVGRIVTYTGKTIKNVELPFSVGDSLSNFCLDTSLNLDEYILSLDWDNPDYTEKITDFTMNYFILMVAGTCSLEQFVSSLNGDFEFNDSVYGECVFYVMETIQNSTGERVFCYLSFIEDPIYYYLNPDFDFSEVDSLPEPGWTDLAVSISNGIAFNI